MAMVMFVLALALMAAADLAPEPGATAPLWRDYRVQAAVLFALMVAVIAVFW